MDESHHLLAEKIRGFVDVSDEMLFNFLEHWKPFSIGRNEYLNRSGKTETHLYFVNEGILRGFVERNGQEHTNGFSYRGDFSGGYDSLIHHGPSLVNVKAEADCSLIRISKRELDIQYDRHKIWERWGRILNGQLAMGMAKQHMFLLSMTAEERYLRFVNHSRHLFQLIAQKHIASYLGMSPETLSRLRAKHT